MLTGPPSSRPGGRHRVGTGRDRSPAGDLLRYRTSPSASAETRDQPQSRPDHAPIRTAGVRSVVSATRSTSTSRVRTPAAVQHACPSGAITPETPFVAATTTYRPVSMARSRVIANCWSIWSVWMNVALLVCTVSSCAPRRSWA